jgi:murein DD-endopeptidase MepM/ murein hydrolase activator NlpD
MKKLICIAIIMLTYGCSSLPVTPTFGYRFQQPYSAFVGGGLHDGLDIVVPLGTPVRSIADGFVIISATWDLRGNSTNVVMIRHDDGTLSKYIHIDKVTVKRGDKVSKGQQFAEIALNGPAGVNTAMAASYPHLHLEIMRKDRLIDPEALNMGCINTVWMLPVGCRVDR